MNSTTAPGCLHDQAQRLAARGFAIVPFHSPLNGGCSCSKKRDCPTKGKHPRLSKWTEASSRDPDQIREWWKKWPTANIGIVTGKPSGIVVLDFDPRHGGRETLDQLSKQCPEMMKTFRVKTGGNGWHFYFQLPESGAKNAVGIMPGLDIRGDGGGIVGPGSFHASGGVYEIQRNAQLLPLPAMLLQLISKRTQERHRRDSRDTQEEHKQYGMGEIVSSKTQLDLNSLTDAQKRQIVKAIERSIPDRAGLRNQHTFMLARRMMAVKGIDQQTDPESLRPIVKKFHEDTMTAAAKLGFSVNAAFADTMEDFRYGWQRVHTPQHDVMVEAIEKCQQVIQTATYPLQVRECLETLGYADDQEMTALILLCWYLDQHWQPFPFFLGARAGEAALSQLGISRINKQTGAREPISHQIVARRLLSLECEGVLRCTLKAKPGQRDTASEYSWTWTTPTTAGQQLDWLT
jgi:hypothetical protein